ncbi:MAG TPA: lactate utilization protein [Xanthobacteraceae bacterium]|nr:lactate utilization protein [Xanthobacteraceae bacterium]
MSGRDVVLGSIRRSLGVSGGEAPRRTVTGERLARHPRGVVPERGAQPPRRRVNLFRAMLAEANGSTEEIASIEDVPAAVAAYLRSKNLPMTVRRGADPLLASVPWEREGTLEVTTGRSDGHQLASVSHAFRGVAETGTLVLTSGGDNPTTLNFLPEHHIVVLEAKDVVGDYESVWDALRKKVGAKMPRTVNWITGASRSADIEQVLLNGAHGPKGLHVIIVGKP